MKIFVLRWRWSSHFDGECLLELTFPTVPEGQQLRAAQAFRRGLEEAGFQDVSLSEKVVSHREILL